jgi:Sulfatase
MKKLGKVERRWSYASWTAPSHYNLLTGLMPHTSPRHVYASEYYKKDFLRYNERLGANNIEFKSLVPKMFLPAFLKDSLGYRTHAKVSLPVLNPHTVINHGFDTFKLMEKHNDMRAMVGELQFSEEQPSFFLLNVGETHYPYALPDEPPDQWPRISGVHGVFKHLDDHVVGGKLKKSKEEKFFDNKKLELLRKRQIEAVKYLDGVVEELFDTVPKNTYITITADHGELFGEDGYFGHGPIHHEKVWEVPFLEGKIR